MTHHHRQRRGATPRPTVQDLRKWERLLTRGARVALNPMGDAQPFVIAAEKAAKAVAPVGHQGAASAFVALVRIGIGFLKLNAVERVEQAERVGGLVGECRAVLDAAPQGRERKDIDG